MGAGVEVEAAACQTLAARGVDPVDRYFPIADHGVIGDLQTAALVTTDGTIDWFCCPRFDSPSVFAALLDREQGGYFRITTHEPDYTTRQFYFPDTAILITRFMAASGVGEIVDFMPIDRPEQATMRHRLVRLVRIVRGEMRFTLDCMPRFDYGRRPHTLDIVANAAVFRTPELVLTLHAPVPLDRHEDDVRAEFTLRAGTSVCIVLESAAEESVQPISPDEVRDLYLRTAAFWRAWLDRSTYRGRWHEVVVRSAITLKLMTYAPSGAMVAAVTAGLPAETGGERNWDSRYTWLRAASSSVYSLLGLGYTDEALAFLRWLRDRIREHRRDKGVWEPLKIVYRVDGSPSPPEEQLDHFEGYQGSRPVRIGNSAADRLHSDLVGEALLSLYLADMQGYRLRHEGWTHVLAMLDWLCTHWNQPDEGIWEKREEPRDYTHDRLMSWVAMDRAIRLARQHTLPADLPRLVAERDRIRHQILRKGWNTSRGTFVQHFGADVLDADLLLMPLVGFVAPQDPMWLSTLRALDQELVSDSLVYRYSPSALPVELRERQGTTSICTYWYVDALARSGRLEEARFVFEKMATYSNHLGLFAEQIAPNGEQLGNFPQSLTHIALINAAMNLDYQLDHGPGWVNLPRLGGRR